MSFELLASNTWTIFAIYLHTQTNKNCEESKLYNCGLFKALLLFRYHIFESIYYEQIYDRS